MSTVDVAIVGGGISGILAARKLIESGLSVLVLEKSKSVGGRMATRRIDEGKADHGAQFFTVRSEEFQTHVDEWIKKGWVKRWFGENYPRYKGSEGMNQLVKNIAQEVPVKLNFKVSHIQKEKNHYLLRSEEEGEVQAKRLLLTAPAPQTAELLEKSECSISETAIKTLTDLQFSPAVVGLLTLSKDAVTRLPASGHQDEGLSEGIERIVDSYTKGISNERVVSIYAKPELSKNLFEESDAAIKDELVSKSSTVLQPEAIRSYQIKRWRYAQAEHVHPSPYLWVDEGEQVLVAGDAFLYEDDESGRTRIESAARSGLAAADAMSERIRKASS